MGTTCASRGPANRDQCCYELPDPSADPSCSAWTTGSCSGVSSDLQMACCLTKDDGRDAACDSILGAQPGLISTSAPPEDTDQPTSDALDTMTEDGNADRSGGQPAQPEEKDREQQQQQQPVIDATADEQQEQPESPLQKEGPVGPEPPTGSDAEEEEER